MQRKMYLTGFINFSVIHSQQEQEELDYAQAENTREEWMIISDLHTPFSDSVPTNSETSYEWHSDRINYSEQQIAEMPIWIKSMRENFDQILFVNNENINLGTFSEMQEVAYNIVSSHFYDMSSNKQPLALIIIGEAGTGKSYLINAIHSLLGDKCGVTATTGKAAFNINGVTVHSLLKLPVGPRGKSDLTGQNLIRLHESLNNIDYIIIDEYSMLGQTTFGWIDRRLKQSSGLYDKLLGGKCVILCGDPAQLPPVADKPLYHTILDNQPILITCLNLMMPLDYTTAMKKLATIITNSLSNCGNQLPKFVQDIHLPQLKKFLLMNSQVFNRCYF